MTTVRKQEKKKHAGKTEGRLRIKKSEDSLGLLVIADQVTYMV